MMLLTKLLKGSICSARPVGENNGQGYRSTIDFKRGSAAIRCAVACSSNIPVVAGGRGIPVFDGEASSTLEGETVTEVPRGVCRIAFVRCGSTGRSSEGGVRCLLSVMVSVARLSRSLAIFSAGGLGNQYDLSVFATCSAMASGAAFLAAETLRGLVMAFCTRVTFGVLCNGDSMVGMEPSRADRRRDIIGHTVGMYFLNRSYICISE